MRVLLTCSLGGVGHLEPVAAVAHAVRRTGHDPLVLVPPSLVAAVERTGLPHAVGDQPPGEVVDAVWARVRAGPPEAVVGLIDRELFAERCTAAMLHAARRVRDSWEPALVVRDPCEYAGAHVACEAGIRQAQVGLSLSALEADVLEMVAPIVGAEAAAAVRAAPYLTRFPASLDPSPWADTRRYRHADPPTRPLPEWWPDDERPLVYVTFGSVLGHLPEAADVYRTALDAVRDLPARVLLTVGHAFAPERLGPPTENTRVKPWVAHSDVLPHAAVVVCHGGSGTTFGALAAGVPLVICPLFADQAANGRLVEAAGAGLLVGAPDAGALRGLRPADVAPLRAAIERVLHDSTYRNAAQRLADETSTSPPLDDVVRSLCAATTGTTPGSTSLLPPAGADRA